MLSKKSYEVKQRKKKVFHVHSREAQKPKRLKRRSCLVLVGTAFCVPIIIGCAQTGGLG